MMELNRKNLLKYMMAVPCTGERHTGQIFTGSMDISTTKIIRKHTHTTTDLGIAGLKALQKSIILLS